jgi:hypothetical protein
MENPFRSLGVVTTGAAHAAGRLELLRQGLYFLLFIFFWLCASLMSRLTLDIMLLQRLGVIGIILILIYSFYLKKFNVELLNLCI